MPLRFVNATIDGTVGDVMHLSERLLTYCLAVGQRQLKILNPDLDIAEFAVQLDTFVL